MPDDVHTRWRRPWVPNLAGALRQQWAPREGSTGTERKKKTQKKKERARFFASFIFVGERMYVVYIDRRCPSKAYYLVLRMRSLTTHGVNFPGELTSQQAGRPAGNRSHRVATLRRTEYPAGSPRVWQIVPDPVLHFPRLLEHHGKKEKRELSVCFSASRAMSCHVMAWHVMSCYPTLKHQSP